MARHAQPREVAELKGATRHDPQRYTAKVPKSDLIVGEPPVDMLEAEQVAWAELQKYAVPGVLTGSERVVMELTASLIAEFRADRRGFPATKIVQLRGLLASLGMTPADRQKFGFDKPKENEFQEF
jgi:hypothetical protein